MKVPSGFNVPEIKRARRFEKEEKRSRFTSKFLYEQAYGNYLNSKSLDDWERVQNLSRKLTGNDLRDATRRINRRFNEQFFSPSERASRSLPKRLRSKFFLQNEGNRR